MGAVKVTTIVLVSIIMIIVLVSLVNVGMSIFLERPDYEDFGKGEVCTEPQQEIRCVPDFDRDAYEEAQMGYNQLRFYVFAGIGFLLLIVGLFVPEIFTKLVSLGSGGVLVTQGIVFNFQDKLAVFISLLAILIIGSFLVIKTVKKMK